MHPAVGAKAAERRRQGKDGEVRESETERGREREGEGRTRGKKRRGAGAAESVLWRRAGEKKAVEQVDSAGAEAFCTATRRARLVLSQLLLLPDELRAQPLRLGPHVRLLVDLDVHEQVAHLDARA
eukprot:6208015-Pleurochrysis_carterae.AAC.1